MVCLAELDTITHTHGARFARLSGLGGIQTIVMHTKGGFGRTGLCLERRTRTKTCVSGTIILSIGRCKSEILVVAGRHPSRHHQVCPLADPLMLCQSQGSRSFDLLLCAIEYQSTGIGETRDQSWYCGKRMHQNISLSRGSQRGCEYAGPPDGVGDVNNEGANDQAGGLPTGGKMRS